MQHAADSGASALGSAALISEGLMARKRDRPKRETKRPTRQQELRDARKRRESGDERQRQQRDGFDRMERGGRNRGR